MMLSNQKLECADLHVVSKTRLRINIFKYQYLTQREFKIQSCFFNH